MASQLATLWLRQPRTGSTTVTAGSGGAVTPACKVPAVGSGMLVHSLFSRHNRQSMLQS